MANLKGFAGTVIPRTATANPATGIMAYTRRTLKAAFKWCDMTSCVLVTVFIQKNLLSCIGVLAHKIRGDFSLNK